MPTRWEPAQYCGFGIPKALRQASRSGVQQERGVDQAQAQLELETEFKSVCEEAETRPSRRRRGFKRPATDKNPAAKRTANGELRADLSLTAQTKGVRLVCACASRPLPLTFRVGYGSPRTGHRLKQFGRKLRCSGCHQKPSKPHTVQAVRLNSEPAPWVLRAASCCKAFAKKGTPYKLGRIW